jgi:RNA:NAD 2'-phosphotransferase (TPT1/KptA family)
LFDQDKADDFVASLRRTFPATLPLVRKRDGHASNWLLDPAGRIVAVDFESNDFIPVGYDVAQLIEDNGLVQASPEGWHRRLALMSRYMGGLGQTLTEPVMASAYSWFALTRALRLGTEREAGKQLRRHARELCGMLVECGDESTRGIARELLQALSRIEHANSTESAPTHDHRRLSKAMAYQLRHRGPSNGVPIDQTGFATMDDLARALSVDASELLAVAEHPGEPRYEVRDGRIRALYGHSIEVAIDAAIDVGDPLHLYHGSSWSALDSIVRDGLTPMKRRMVHLTNMAEEAMAVGRRKGAPLVFSIDQSHDEEPVADGIWVAAMVPRQRLSIVNPFVEEAGAVR